MEIFETTIDNEQRVPIGFESMGVHFKQNSTVFHKRTVRCY